MAMNIANAITFIRFLLVIAGVIILIFLVIPYQFCIAAILFTLAFFSDFLDGYVFKRTDFLSQLFTFIDPLINKILIFSYFIILQYLDLFPLWLLLAILVCTFIHDGFTNFAASQRVIIGVTYLYKFASGLQAVAIIMVLLVLSLHDEIMILSTAHALPFLRFAFILMVLSLFVYLLDTVQMMRRHIALISDNE